MDAGRLVVAIGIVLFAVVMAVLPMAVALGMTSVAAGTLAAAIGSLVAVWSGVKVAAGAGGIAVRLLSRAPETACVD